MNYTALCILSAFEKYSTHISVTNLYNSNWVGGGGGGGHNNIGVIGIIFGFPKLKAFCAINKAPCANPFSIKIEPLIVIY